MAHPAPDVDRLAALSDRVAFPLALVAAVGLGIAVVVLDLSPMARIVEGALAVLFALTAVAAWQRIRGAAVTRPESTSTATSAGPE